MLSITRDRRDPTFWLDSRRARTRRARTAPLDPCGSLDRPTASRRFARSSAHAVRGPKHVIKRGNTPVLTREETRELLDAIETDDIAGLRDRALIGLLVFSFARIGAALTLKVDLSTEA